MEKAHVTVNKETTTFQDSVPFLEDIQTWRQQLVRGVFRAVAIVGPLAIVVGSYYAYVTDVAWLIPAYLGAYGILLLITFWPKVPYSLQAGTLLGLIYALSILDFIQDGQGGSGRLFLLTFLVVAALLFGRRGGSLALALSMLTILGFALGFSTGQIAIPAEREVSSTNLVGWLSNTFVWLLMGTLLLVSQNYLIPPLVVALTRNRRLAEELEKRQAELKKQVTDRTTALEQRSAQLEATAQVAREATAIRDVSELLDKTVALVSEHFGFYHTGIFLADEAGEYAVLRAASSEGGQQMIARGHKLRVGQTGFVGSVAGTGQPRVALNVASRIEAPPDSIFRKHGFAQDSWSQQTIDAEDTASFSVPELPLTRSEMALPLKAHDRVTGVLDIHSTQAAAFSEEDKAILQILADQVALAIENARLLEEAEERFHEVDVLLGHHSQEGWQRLATERPRWGYTYDGTATVPHDTGYEIKTELEPQLTVPLQIRGLSIGNMELDLANKPLTPDAEALAQAVAEQASQALENARLFQAAQRSLRETETLYLASQAIGAADSVEKVGQALMDYAATSGVDAARFLLFEHDATSVPGGGMPTHIVMREGWTVDNRHTQPYGTSLPMEDYPLADLMDPNTPIIVQDILTDPRANEMAQTFLADISGLRALIMTPIATGGRWIGMLSAGLNEPFKFPEELVRGYETLAGQAAVALEGIRLLEETRQRAEQERLTSEITSRMRETLDIDTVLQTAIREIGQALDIAQVEVRMASGLTKIKESM